MVSQQYERADFKPKQEVVELLNKSGYSKNTTKTYASAYSRFLEYVDTEKLLAIGEKEVQSFLRLLSAGPKITTQTYKNALATCFDMIDIDDMNWKSIKVAQGSRGRRIPKFLSRDQVDAIINFYRDDRRFQASLRVCYHCALRVNELVSLKGGDIDLRDKTVRVIGKGDYEDYIPITEDELIMAIEPVMSKVGADEWLLPGKSDGEHLSTETIRWRFKEACGVLGFHATPHYFRHSRGTHLIQMGLDVFYVQKYLRHTNIASTTLYLSTTVDELRSKVAVLQGKK